MSLAYQLILFHEAGHAVVGHCLGHDLLRLSVDPRPPAGLAEPPADFAMFAKEEPRASIENARGIAARLFGARVSVEEAVSRGKLPAGTDPAHGWAGADPETADEARIHALSQIARTEWGTDPSLFLAETETEARRIVSTNWPVIEGVVELLRASRVLSRGQLAALVLGGDAERRVVVSLNHFRKGRRSTAQLAHGDSLAVACVERRRDLLPDQLTPHGLAAVWNQLDAHERRIAQKLMIEREVQKAKAAYVDPSRPERHCTRCGRPYRGPRAYCCLECAEADA